MSAIEKIQSLLGREAENLLLHACQGIPRDRIHVPASDHVDRCFGASDRHPQVLVNLQRIHSTGRLGGTGYLSILPVDQGVEHSAAASFAPNPDYFDPEKIVELALAGGCSAVACTLGGLGQVARRYAHRIPFIVKINHNQLLTYPNGFRETMFARVRQCWDTGAAAVGATIYFGSEDADREIEEVGEAFAAAHGCGLATILWCYLRNPAFNQGDVDHHSAADLTAQANHLGVSLGADLIKQKLPTHNGGYNALKGFGKTNRRVYGELVAEHPVDYVRWQVANCYMGRIGMVNSGGASSGALDLAEAVRAAVINKRGGGMGLIAGRKVFQRPMVEGVALLHAIQDVYLAPEVTVA